MKPPTRLKVVKAFAIIGEQGHLAHENDCPLIYRRMGDAKLYCRMTDEIVPCTIHYSLPKPTKRK